MKPIEIVGLVVLIDRGKKGMKKQTISMDKYREFAALHEASKPLADNGIEVLFGTRTATPAESWVRHARRYLSPK